MKRDVVEFDPDLIEQRAVHNIGIVELKLGVGSCEENFHTILILDSRQKFKVEKLPQRYLLENVTL